MTHGDGVARSRLVVCVAVGIALAAAVVSAGLLIRSFDRQTILGLVSFVAACCALVLFAAAALLKLGILHGVTWPRTPLEGVSFALQFSFIAASTQRLLVLSIPLLIAWVATIPAMSRERRRRQT